MDKITLLIGDKNNVDFDKPIYMDEEKRKKFFELLKSLFAVVNIEDNFESRDWRMGSEGRIQYPHVWTSGEYEFLLKCHSLDEAIDKLGRSGMSVLIRMGDWIPRYYNWAAKKNKDMSKINDISLIEEFMKEHENEIKKKRNIKKEQNAKIKEAKKTIENYTNREKEINFMISIGKSTQSDLEKLKKEKSDAELLLKELENEG